jgi:SNF2 family DNA or RNA helicase
VSFILHANWSEGVVHLWCEDVSLARAALSDAGTSHAAASLPTDATNGGEHENAVEGGVETVDHPFAALVVDLARLVGHDTAAMLAAVATPGTLVLRLPARDAGRVPLPSDELSRSLALGGAGDAGAPGDRGHASHTAGHAGDARESRDGPAAKGGSVPRSAAADSLAGAGDRGEAHSDLLDFVRSDPDLYDPDMLDPEGGDIIGQAASSAPGVDGTHREVGREVGRDGGRDGGREGGRVATSGVSVPAAGTAPAVAAPGASGGGVGGGGATSAASAAVAQGVSLGSFRVATLTFPARHAERAVLTLSEETERRSYGAGLAYLAACARFVRFLAAQQRFVPMVVQTMTAEMRGAWMPWLSDEATAQRARTLVGAMPGIARAADDRARHSAWLLTQEAIGSMLDARCRRVLCADDFLAAVRTRDASDPHVAWLSALLGESDEMRAPMGMRQDVAKRVRAWIGALEERGASGSWRLLLRVGEPVEAMGRTVRDEDAQWLMTFHLQAVDAPTVVVDAEDVWAVVADSMTIQGRRLDAPQELLLAELGRAARLYPALERALEDGKPHEMRLATRLAYEFLREIRPILMEQGFAVEAPEWWDSPTARLGAKLRLESTGVDPLAAASAGGAAGASLGLGTLVRYRWEISVGDTTLSLHEFEQLAAKRTPLVKVNGRWVEIRPEDVHAAIKFIRENPGGDIRIADALRMAYASDLRQTGIPVVGLDASGWMQAFLNSESAARQFEIVQAPSTFHGTLRPYQVRGVSWLAFQEALGFGVCLADDMGLGKTVQLLALLAYERELAAGRIAMNGTPIERAPDAPAPIPSRTIAPTLLVVPMSVVGNWIHETARFCPSFRVLVHHGADRALGDDFVERARASDLVITTYALANRDKEHLAKVAWERLVLDEAQYIKNPQSKQAQAVHALEAKSRIALTGTPVENRLTELWSIMDFLNPGYLGPAGGFRQRFGVPIERYHDRRRAEQLKGLIRPFVLRRLKSDPTVVADLPDKVESREFTHLTGEQASLYESCVRRMLHQVDEAEGIQRRGLVLAALVKLKQICNHPALALKEGVSGMGGGPVDPARSGKCIRLLEMLEELLAEGDQALVFTQFREMGAILAPMLAHHAGKPVLFLHGGTTQAQRQQMIDTFQRGDGSHPILILSLKAGGVGLNLTAATHVFHFDRWWNPAVENQATDRAYRIGQTRTVQVHKFVCRGTLEERIDQMIESKTELAANIIGAGESWLTELDTRQLHEILTLRNDAVEDEA